MMATIDMLSKEPENWADKMKEEKKKKRKKKKKADFFPTEP